MSILDNGIVDVTPPENKAANQLINLAVRSYEQMVNTFNRGAIIFWENPQGLSPNEIADALGDNAKEIFELHSKLGELIISINPQSIAEGLSVVGDFTINDDGTVNVLAPAPEVQVLDSGVTPSGNS